MKRYIVAYAQKQDNKIEYAAHEMRKNTRKIVDNMKEHNYNENTNMKRFK